MDEGILLPGNALISTILRGLGVKDFPHQQREDATSFVGTTNYSPPEVDRIWLWVYYNKIPMYPIFYLLKGDYSTLSYL